MNKEKIGLTTTNWILSILGIIVLTCFIVLPPVFRIYFPKEKEEIKEPVILPVLTTTCLKEQINSDNYVDNESYTFNHQDNKVLKYSKSVNRTYKDPMLYQQEKQSYGVLVTAFSILSGYDYSATPDDNLSQVSIVETYDLKTFNPTMIVVPGDEEPTSITSDYNLNDSIVSIKQELITNGYVCSNND